MSDLSLQEHLAYAYRLIADWRLDDHTYTHLSVRASEQSYYLAPFGKRFEEVMSDDLLEIAVGTHEILSGEEVIINKTAYYLHSPIYKQLSHIGAILHLHTPEMIAVSVDPEGLRPWSQWALHFHGDVGYYDYDSLLLSDKQSLALAKKMSKHSVIFMRHHGVIIVAKTLWEAMFYLHHLQKACQTQCLIQSQNISPIEIKPAVAKKAHGDLLKFEENLGWRDWCAWIRYLNRKEESIKKISRGPTSYYSHAPYKKS